MPERTPHPGVTWGQQLQHVERVVSDQDDGESPFGWRELPEHRPMVIQVGGERITVTPWDTNPKAQSPISRARPMNRQQRRAVARANRQKGTGS